MIALLSAHPYVGIALALAAVALVVSSWQIRPWWLAVVAVVTGLAACIKVLLFAALHPSIYVPALWLLALCIPAAANDAQRARVSAVGIVAAVLSAAALDGFAGLAVFMQFAALSLILLVLAHVVRGVRAGIGFGDVLLTSAVFTVGASLAAPLAVGTAFLVNGISARVLPENKSLFTVGLIVGGVVAFTVAPQGWAYSAYPSGLMQ